MKAIAMLLAVLAADGAGAQTMLTLHENSAGPVCYRAPLGAVFQVSLPASAGTGYAWSKRDGDALEQVGEAMVGQPAGGPMIADGPQIQTLRFKPIRPGRNTLTLALARSWEKGVAPVRRLSFCLDTPAP